jgi:Fe-S-cluster containining protein
MARRSGAKSSGIHPENPCHGCESLCCRYIAVQTAQPRHRDEYELIRWQLAHEGVCVYVDAEGDWMVQVATPCRHLVNHRCDDYENRPKVCREYESHSCERAGGGEENIAEFTTAEEFERFFRLNFRFQGSSVRRRHRTWRTAPG